MPNIAAQHLTNRISAPPGLLGALVLALALVLRAVSSATAERVFLFGRELHWGCWFERRFDFPCPTGGLTRGFLLALDGQFGAAWHLNPAAPLLVSGLVAFAFAMLWLAAYRRGRSPLAAGRLHGRIRTGASIYGWLLSAVLLVNWLMLVFVR